MIMPNGHAYVNLCLYMYNLCLIIVYKIIYIVSSINKVIIIIIIMQSLAYYVVGHIFLVS